MQRDPSRRPGASASAPAGGRGGEVPAPAEEAGAAIARLHEEMRACTRCPQLVPGRTQVVPGAGSAGAPVVAIAESPGAEEDRTGRPLSRAAHEALDRALAGAGVDPSAVYVTTLLKCHPPGNRDPSPGEVARCQAWLVAQLEAIRPRVVVLIGAGPTRALAPDLPPLRAGRGRPALVDLGGRRVRVLPVRHPYAATYGDPAALAEDLGALGALLAEPVGPDPATVDPSDTGAAHPEPADPDAADPEPAHPDASHPDEPAHPDAARAGSEEPEGPEGRASPETAGGPTDLDAAPDDDPGRGDGPGGQLGLF